MEARGNSQLLLSLTLLSVFCSQTLELPSETSSTISRLGNGTLFDGPNEPDQNLDLFKVENEYLETLLPENDFYFGGALTSLNKKRRNDEESSDIEKLLDEEAAIEFFNYLAESLSCEECSEPPSLRRHYSRGVSDTMRKLIIKGLTNFLHKILRILERNL